ncbi:MAG: DUF6515 family protein [Pseudomonadota bacterium]
MRTLSATAFISLLLTTATTCIADDHGHGWGWFGAGALFGSVVVGTIVTSLPENHTVVIANGKQYYCDGTHYYQETTEGYVIVECPATPVTVVISSPDEDGDDIHILLNKKGKGYVGPKGEYYNSLPSAAQLKAVYGNQPGNDNGTTDDE